MQDIKVPLKLTELTASGVAKRGVSKGMASPKPPGTLSGVPKYVFRGYGSLPFMTEVAPGGPNLGPSPVPVTAGGP